MAYHRYHLMYTRIVRIQMLPSSGRRLASRL